MATDVRVHLSIDVPDLDAGVAFYTRVFGFNETARPFPTMAILDANNVTICVHEKKPGSRATPSEHTVRSYERHWTAVHADFHVTDFAGTLQRAEEAGAAVEQRFATPKQAAFCSDPFGNGFCIINAE